MMLVVFLPSLLASLLTSPPPLLPSPLSPSYLSQSCLCLSSLQVCADASPLSWQRVLSTELHHGLFSAHLYRWRHWNACSRNHWYVSVCVASWSGQQTMFSYHSGAGMVLVWPHEVVNKVCLVIIVSLVNLSVATWSGQQTMFSYHSGAGMVLVWPHEVVWPHDYLSVASGHMK